MLHAVTIRATTSPWRAVVPTLIITFYYSVEPAYKYLIDCIHQLHLGPPDAILLCFLQVLQLLPGLLGTEVITL